MGVLPEHFKLNQAVTDVMDVGICMWGVRGTSITL